MHLAAPGEWIFSTYPLNKPGNGTAPLSGTSMAVPMVSGAAALLMSAAGGSLRVPRLRNLLLDSVDRVPDLEGKLISGVSGCTKGGLAGWLACKCT